jgi:hypothetical protein
MFDPNEFERRQFELVPAALLPRRRLGSVPRRGWIAADADCRLAQKTSHHFVPVVVFHEHELAALRIRALNGEDHRSSFVT